MDFMIVLLKSGIIFLQWGGFAKNIFFTNETCIAINILKGNIVYTEDQYPDNAIAIGDKRNKFSNTDEKIYVYIALGSIILYIGISI